MWWQPILRIVGLAFCWWIEVGQGDHELPELQRDYSRYDYVVIELADSGGESRKLKRSLEVKRAQEVASKWGEYEVLGRVGELDRFFLLRKPKERSDPLSPTERPSSEKGKQRKSETEKEKEKRQDSPSFVKTSQLQVPRRRYKRDSPEHTTAGSKGHVSHDDPLFHLQWHLFNTGTRKRDINVSPVWTQNITGQGVTVAIVDDGVDEQHPDIHDNFNYEASFDFNDLRAVPSPLLKDDYHGTRCAGEVVALPNNVCGVGVAYGAKVSGIRLLSREVDAATEAVALNYKFQENDIYSCSWGPFDDGSTVEAPEAVVQEALLNGVTHGRQGRGSVFVFASGNGGVRHDDCNYDGYANSIYTLTVGAVNDVDQSPSYAEHCAAQFLVAYSSGWGRQIVTSDIHGQCTTTHGGTSAAAPLMAGAIALVLSARPDLSWRDLQYLSVHSAIPFSEDSHTDWDMTYAKRPFSHMFGYGKLDVEVLLNNAMNFTSVNPQVRLESGELVQVEGPTKGLPIPRNGQALSIPFLVTPQLRRQPQMQWLEHVTVTVSMEHPRRGDVEVQLESPHRIVSVLAKPRVYDDSNEGLSSWTFTTVKHWEEDPEGEWTVRFIDHGVAFTGGSIQSCSIQFYGQGEGGIANEVEALGLQDMLPITSLDKNSLGRLGLGIGVVGMVVVIPLLLVLRHRRRKYDHGLEALGNQGCLT